MQLELEETMLEKKKEERHNHWLLERTTKLKAYLGTTFSYGRYCFVSPTMTLYMTTFSPTPPATIGYNYPGKQYHLIFQKHKNATETGRQLVNNFEYIAIIFNKKIL